ncbi:MAG TPA: TRAP transporter large permease subunit [Burkholderiaceae bacterium]|nr:TRAP transporter large permease subunit [Burkholderiaceae bacterium]
MNAAGIWLLLLAAAVMIATGLPAWVVLVGVASVGALTGIALDVVPAALFESVPPRIVGLLENDLLQALPLYVFMGALLNRLALSDALFRVLRRLVGAPVAGLLLGALLAPMNGSVGASVATLARTVHPRLRESGFGAGRAAALIATAGTLGVVVPPSLVLILFGDAAMRAHTEAVNVTHASVRILNTQDVFRGALVPAALLLIFAAAVAFWQGRSQGASRPVAAQVATLADWITAAVTFTALVVLLGAVTLGYMYAVEAAATGGVVLFAYGVLSRTLDRATLAAAMRETLALTGALFALLIGATMLTLVMRAFETDRWLADVLVGLPGGPAATLAAGLAIIGLAALVLDAFEMIFVVVPLVLPPLLQRLPDASWVAVLALLILQTSFLLPPFGFALLMTRNRLGASVSLRELAGAIRPFLLAQIAVLALVLALPRLVHLAQPPEIVVRQLTPEEIERELHPVAPDTDSDVAPPDPAQ